MYLTHKDNCSVTDTSVVSSAQREKNGASLHFSIMLSQFFLEIFGEATASFASLWLRACLILSSQASARSSIIENSASALTAQSAFLNFEDIINQRVDIRKNINRYQDTLSYASGKGNYSVGFSINHCCVMRQKEFSRKTENSKIESFS